MPVKPRARAAATSRYTGSGSISASAKNLTEPASMTYPMGGDSIPMRARTSSSSVVTCTKRYANIYFVGCCQLMISGYLVRGQT